MTEKTVAEEDSTTLFGQPTDDTGYICPLFRGLYWHAGWLSQASNITGKD